MLEQERRKQGPKFVASRGWCKFDLVQDQQVWSVIGEYVVEVSLETVTVEQRAADQFKVTNIQHIAASCSPK